MHREIIDALATGEGVVALETTLVAHGFPAGEGAKVGEASETAVRGAGRCPATIGVLDGEVRVGLDATTLGTFDQRGQRGAQARPARSRGLLRAAGARRDDGRRHARRLPRRRGSA